MSNMDCGLSAGVLLSIPLILIDALPYIASGVWGTNIPPFSGWWILHFISSWVYMGSQCNFRVLSLIILIFSSSSLHNFRSYSTFLMIFFVCVDLILLSVSLYCFYYFFCVFHWSTLGIIWWYWYIFFISSPFSSFLPYHLQVCLVPKIYIMPLDLWVWVDRSCSFVCGSPNCFLYLSIFITPVCTSYTKPIGT